MLSELYRRTSRLLFERRPPSVIRSVRSESLTYLNNAALMDLCGQVELIEQHVALQVSPGSVTFCMYTKTGVTPRSRHFVTNWR